MSQKKDLCRDIASIRRTDSKTVSSCVEKKFIHTCKLIFIKEDLERGKVYTIVYCQIFFSKEFLFATVFLKERILYFLLDYISSSEVEYFVT